MRRLLVILPLLLFVGVAGAFAVQLLRGADPSKLPSALIDRPVPDFALDPVPATGMPGLSTADLRGRVAVVNVFASWCAPCRVEHPLITRLAEREGIPVFGLNHKDAAGDAADWLKRLGNPYARIGADLSGRVSIDWGVYGVPETFVVDHLGRIRHRHVGPLTPRDVEATILPLVRELRRRAADGVS
ncbi:MAG TPA: DsbE family thiol:disulfide interchange protein [Azospirillaceae bacterium]|nr:DsbE family thiol:disulfide interchange protein [Azospirillaceae bacterium]